MISLKDCNLYFKLEKKNNRLFSPETFKNIFGKLKGHNKHDLSFHVLKHITLDVSSNSSVALLGHNGAGKSTLLRLIAGIYPLGSGEITVRGDITCFLGQGLGLDNEMTGKEYLYLVSALKNKFGSESDIFVEEVSNFIEIGDFINQPVRIYSAGMRARLLTSAALFQNPDIVLLDEGVGAGDFYFSKKLEIKLREFLSLSNCSVIASHNFNFLRNWCDKGIVLDKGQIVFEGSVDDAIAFHKCQN